jgi:hypothetical protein
MDESNTLIDSHPFSDRPQQSCLQKYKNHLLIGLGIVLVLGVVVGLIVGLTLRSRPSADGLANAVTVKNIMKHLQQFQNIANDPVNKGSRGVLEGYNQCLDYVQNTLSKTGCVLTTQSFLAPVFYERATPSMNYTVGVKPSVVLQAGVDFLTMRYGGNGTYNIVAPVKLVANAGCNETDWDGIVAGDVAIAMYQTPGNGVSDCTAYQKATIGAKRGAGAILIANDVSRKTLLASRIRGDGYAPTDYLVQVPVLAISHSLAEALTTQLLVEVSLKTQTEIIVATTQNLYCTTPDGDENNLVVIGAHLDGVPAGPGINDNASGSATLLEIVLQFFKLKFKPKNQKIQFSWWGAEEIGLLGSRAFVNSSKEINSPVRFETIKMGVNFDMLASPNGIPEYHDLAAGNPGFPASSTQGSNAISAAFKNAFEKVNVASLASPMTGGSDYYPFALAGIPAGGLATGAGGLKSMEQRTTYGGLANAAMDPCYHQACDTIENINQELLGFTSQAASRAIATFALAKDINTFLAKGYESMD